MNRKLDEIARMSGGSVPELFGEVEVRGVACDLKNVRTGCLYIPRVTEGGDGHYAAEEAIRKGAAAMLWQNGHPSPYPGHIPAVRVDDLAAAVVELARAYRKELPVRTVVVAGSDGKTTTKDMLATLLTSTYKVHQYGADTRSPMVDLAYSILEMDEETQMAVFELPWNGETGIGEQSRLLAPEIGVITNVGEANLQFLATRREIAQEAVKVLEGLIPGGLLIYNGEEPLLEEALAEAVHPEGLLTYRFGSEGHLDMHPIAIMNEPEGTSFKTNLPMMTYYKIPLLGLHNIMNAMAALAASKYLGVLDQDASDGFRRLDRCYARLTPMRTRFGAVILNDAMSASPTSMKAAIELLKDLPGYQRKIVVLGDMVDLGPDEVRYHKEIGAMLTAPEIYKVFAYGTLAKHIASEASKGLPSGRVRWFHEKAELIDAVAAEARERDAILVKGSRMMGLDELVDILTGV
ncbi:UDP-N-acetylmuramoyl-tripeptide--D-alanyl-D-alanine ligase [Gorillibacterium sp. sgz5001074]|uniref:UDP-N-acetylmuramoyl-tripeptide--D-alanyl-D- alanine ligase n=1 Tax=Gorillibacterium sp. sgz5001074 TaxID=3446695 RepID=UPI003F663EF8